MAIILISSELPELLGMSDRILVLREGRVMDEMEGAAATPERVLKAATDAKSENGSSGTGSKLLAVTAGLPEHPMPPNSKRSNLLVSTIRQFLLKREFGLIAAMAAVIIPVAAINPRMLSGPNLTALSMDAALLIIVAVAQMLVLLTRRRRLDRAALPLSVSNLRPREREPGTDGRDRPIRCGGPPRARHLRRCRPRGLATGGGQPMVRMSLLAGSGIVGGAPGAAWFAG